MNELGKPFCTEGSVDDTTVNQHATNAPSVDQPESGPADFASSVVIPDYESFSDDDNDDERYVSNSSRKRAYLMEKQNEQPTAPSAEQSRKTLFGVIGNFIYYHKLFSAVIAILAIFAAIARIRAYCQSRIDYNIGVYTCDINFTAAQIDTIEQTFAVFGEDVNGDGRVIVKVRTYHPIGDDIISFFVNFFCLQRDIYNDVKHGSRVNDILITDKTVCNSLYSMANTNFFDKLNGEEFWVGINGTVLPEDIPYELGIMLPACSIYGDHDTALRRYNNAKKLFESIDEQTGIFDCEQK